jgi:hypothetical protein
MEKGIPFISIDMNHTFFLFGSLTRGRGSLQTVDGFVPQRGAFRFADRLLLALLDFLEILVQLIFGSSDNVRRFRIFMNFAYVIGIFMN